MRQNGGFINTQTVIVYTKYTAFIYKHVKDKFRKLNILTFLQIKSIVKLLKINWL